MAVPTNIKKLILYLIFASFIWFPQFGYTQVWHSGGKIKQQKAKRVFYGNASYYANKFDGRKTANGDIFNQNKLTCACNVLPLGSWIKVTNLRNGRTVVVLTNDRLHPKMRRVVDLSRAAAVKLDFISRGVTRVKVELFTTNSQ